MPVIESLNLQTTEDYEASQTNDIRLFWTCYEHQHDRWAPLFARAPSKSWQAPESPNELFTIERDHVTYAGIPLKRGLKIVPEISSWHQASLYHVPHQILGVHSVAPCSTSALLARLLRPTLPGNIIGSVPELAQVLSEINALAFETEEDERGLLRPSYHALKHCLRLILALAETGDLARPSEISSDPNGALRITWNCGNREAELICPFEDTERPYVYYSSPDAYGTHDDVTPDTLLQMIRWALNNA